MGVGPLLNRRSGRDDYRRVFLDCTRMTIGRNRLLLARDTCHEVDVPGVETRVVRRRRVGSHRSP